MWYPDKEKEDLPPTGKARVVKTDLYINGEHYVKVVEYDYFGDVAFESIYKQ